MPVLIYFTLSDLTLCTMAKRERQNRPLKGRVSYCEKRHIRLGCDQQLKTQCKKVKRADPTQASWARTAWQRCHSLGFLPRSWVFRSNLGFLVFFLRALGFF